MPDEMSGQAWALGGCVLMEDVSDLLGAVIGDFHTDMCLICREGCAESFLLARGELVCGRRAGEAGFGRGDRLCVRGDRSCLAGRDGVPHLGRRQLV